MILEMDFCRNWCGRWNKSVHYLKRSITKEEYNDWRYTYPASQAALERAAREKRRKDRKAEPQD